MAINTLILIDRDKIQFSSGGKILSLPMPPTLIKDLEIVDKNVLMNEIGSFVQKNEIVFGETLILLSEAVCFIDESGSGQDFASTLPFENSATVSLGGRLIGTNKDLYESVIELVGRYGGEVKGIAPIFLSKETFNTRSLDEPTVKFISSNESTFMKGYFGFNVPVPVLTALRPKAKTTPLTPWLIGAFVVLAVILVIILIVRR